MKNTYRTQDEADRDKTQLTLLLAALNASPSSLRHDNSGLWILRGRPGCTISTSGDGESWQLVVTPEREISKQAWTWIKKRLAFCELTRDGGQEGVFRLHRLPSAAEAEAIRDIIGIRKRMELSPEELARRQQLGRRYGGSGSVSKAAGSAVLDGLDEGPHSDSPDGFEQAKNQ